MWSRCLWIACVLCWQLGLPVQAQSFEPETTENAAESSTPLRAAGDDLISDPELGETEKTGSRSGAGQAEVIDDPELSGQSANAPRASGLPSVPSDSGPPPSEVHMVLHTRGNRDLKQDDPREQIWESTTIFTLDATLRRSESLRFGLGISARYHVASLAHSLPDAHAMRYDLDALPTSGYVDASLAPGLHVRAGYQPVSLGRFDVFSATNVLTVTDMRDGPASIPGRPEVGQLALMVDYDPAPWLSLRAIYIPFFMPNIVSVVESDYALLPGNQQSWSAAIDPLVGDDDDAKAALNAQFKQHLLRSARDRLAMGVLSAFTPQPHLSAPQGALRATAHAGFGEISATFSTALEHMPSFRVSDETLRLLADDDPDNDADDPEPISVEYTRFAVISLDASFDVPPFQIGFELAYQLHRALYAVGTAYDGDPLAIPTFGHSDLMQAGARVEYTESTNWLFALETFVTYAMQVPSDPERGWIAFEMGRYLRGVGGMFGYVSDFGLSLQIGAAWLSGPSVVFSPRLAYDIFPQLTVEVGAFIIDGQSPPPFVTPILSVGGIWNNLDHVFVGLRAAL